MCPGSLKAALRAAVESATAFGDRVVVAFGVADAESAVVDARPAEALMRVAADRGARMIVAGTHGEYPLAGAVLGSVPHKLLHLSKVPVLVVPVRA